MVPTLASFPEGTRFADVDGVPVSCTPGFVCRNWLGGSPTPFNVATFELNGETISEARFRSLVMASRSPEERIPAAAAFERFMATINPGGKAGS